MSKICAQFDARKKNTFNLLYNVDQGGQTNSTLLFTPNIKERLWQSQLIYKNFGVYVFALSLFYWALGPILGFLSILRGPRPVPRAFHFHHGAQGAEESYLTVMLAKFIAQIDLVSNSKQWTCLNKACYLVTRLVKFYLQDKRPTMVARRATLSESEWITMNNPEITFGIL